MRITQGTFSYLPDFSDEEIEAQLRYALSHNWAIMIEHTDDPHPRNPLWDMWSPPMFDLEEDETDTVMQDIRAAREAFPRRYIKIVCYDRSLGRQTSKLSFIINRPEDEPGFRLDRQETHDRTINYTLHPYASEDPPERRYGAAGQETKVSVFDPMAPAHQVGARDDDGKKE